MIFSFLTGMSLGLYMVIAFRFWDKYKITKYGSYARFTVVVSVSILGPACIYILRLIYGTGPDGDPPLFTSVIFGSTALTTFFAYLIYQSKNATNGKNT